MVSYEQAFNTLQQLLQQQNNAAAISLAQQIVKLRPKEFTPKLQLMHLLINERRYTDARPLVEQLLLQKPNDLQVLNLAGYFYQQTGDGEYAIQLLSKSVAIKPRDLSLLLRLALVYSEVGNVEQALATYQKVIDLDHGNADARWGRARLLKATMADEELQELIRLDKQARTQRPTDGSEKRNANPENPEALAKLNFSIAWALDGRDRIEEEMHYLHRANQLASTCRPWNPDNYARYVQQNMDFFNEQRVAALRGQGNTVESPIFLAGLPRSGTSLTEQIIGSHSAISPCGETGAFNYATTATGGSVQCWEWRNVDNFAPYLQTIDTQFKRYMAAFNTDGRRISDKTMDSVETAGLILLTYPNAKIIHCMRNPLDVIFSCYQLYFALGQNFCFKLLDIAHRYQQHVMIMDHWKHLFPNNIITINYADLVENQERATRDLLAFCELPWEDQCLEFYKNRNIVRTASKAQVKQAIFRHGLDRWRPYAKHLQPTADYLGITLD